MQAGSSCRIIQPSVRELRVGLKTAGFCLAASKSAARISVRPGPDEDAAVSSGRQRYAAPVEKDRIAHHLPRAGKTLHDQRHPGVVPLPPLTSHGGSIRGRDLYHVIPPLEPKSRFPVDEQGLTRCG